MKSIYDETPVFSQSQTIPYNSDTQVQGRKRSAPPRRRHKALIRDIGFPTNNTFYPVTSFYRFPEKKHAACFDSIRVKREEDPEVHFTNNYRSDLVSEPEVTRSLKISAKTLVLIHPLLSLTSLNPQKIYIPISGHQLKFTLVTVVRKESDFANLQVQVTADAINPFFSPTTLFQEVSKNRSFKATQLALQRRRESNDLDSQIIRVTYPDHLQIGSGQQGSLQTLPYRFEETSHVRSPLPPRFPTLQQATPPFPSANHLPPSKAVYQKGKVALCNNCGIYSDNLETCCRCKKPNMGPIFEDSDLSNKKSSLSKKVKKPGKENETKSEVVDLSSDENEDSQEAIVSTGCLSDNSQRFLTSLLCPKQNGKDSSTDKTTPEDVIKILSEVTSKSDGCSMFALVTSSYIRVGTYFVTVSPGFEFTILTTIGEAGLYFKLPAYDTGVTKEIGIPKNQILNLLGYRDPHTFYIKVQTGPKFAKWVRSALNMDEDPNGACYFCPLHGDASRREFIIMFAEVDENKAAVLRRLYKDVYNTDNKHELNVPRGGTDIGTDGVCVKVLWHGHNSTSTEKLTPKGIVTEFPKHTAVRMKSEQSVVDESRKLFHYPFVPVDTDASFYTDNSISLTTGDIACLGDLQYLNDQVMDFWMRQIVDQLSPAEKDKAYVFNTFFYKRLTTKPNCKRKSVNTFEYDSSLSQAEKRHCRVKNWTKKVDIFEKDFLFIPINENAHWFLVVICFPGMVPLNEKPSLKPSGPKHSQAVAANLPQSNENGDNDRDEAMSDPDETKEGDKRPEEERMETSDNMGAEVEDPTAQADEHSQAKEPEDVKPDVKPDLKTSSPLAHVKRPCIIIFDSLGPENRSRIFTTLREYLQIEHNSRKGATTRVFDRHSVAGIMPSVPFQPNGCDCGLYVLSYTEAFFRKPITNFTSGRTIKIKNWFTDEEAASKRQQIYDFIGDYVRKNFPENSQYIMERSIHIDEATSSTI